MTTVATAIPDNLFLRQGEEVEFKALVQADGSFLVTKVLRREPYSATQGSDPGILPSRNLGDWARTWSGAAVMPSGKTWAEVKSGAYNARFGA